MKTKYQLNLSRLFFGVLLFTAIPFALATTDKCKTEAREVAKLIKGFNKSAEGFSTISATLVDENTEYDHLLTYEVEYINPDTGDKYPFADTLVMTLHAEGRPEEKCTLSKFEEGGA